MTASYTDAQKRATTKYQKSVEELKVRIPKDSEKSYGLSKDMIKECADSMGISVNDFILSAICEKIQTMQK